MNRLFDKIYGCIAGCFAGSAMGAPVESWRTEAIIEQYGVLDEFLPYSHYEPTDKGGGRWRPAGMTEDGVERIKLLSTAIIEKKDRVTAEDLAKVWVRDINPDTFGVQMEPSDVTMYRLLKAGVVHNISGNPSWSAPQPAFFPAADAGRYAAVFGRVGYPRSCQPLGIINAANPEQAFIDAIEVGKMLMPPHDTALLWAAAVAVAISVALKPDATIESVIEAVTEYAPNAVTYELEKGLVMAERSEDVFDMREPFNVLYCNISGFNPMSKAHEVVTKAFAILSKTGGDPKESIIGAINFGRDTDCLAAVAGGISGALKGADAIPDEWIKCVDDATKQEAQYTVSDLTIKETSEGLYEALQEQLRKQKERIEMLEASST